MATNGKISDKEILSVLSKFPGGAGIEDIKQGLGREIHLRTLQRRLKNLLLGGTIHTSGKASAIRYKLATVEKALGAIAVEPKISAIPLSEAGTRIREIVTAPIQQREPAGYHREFLETYRPNIDRYLNFEEIERLEAIGNTGSNQAAGTYAMQIFNRLLIDLSWNSSRLEGNTYSLLDTERLLELGEADETKTAKEAQMILNHKDAIEFIVEGAEEVRYDRYTITNLHALLSYNLLPDPHASGRLRSMAVGITGSVFTPLAIPPLISELFDQILEKASQIENPFEQSFFIMVNLPYLQPFDDVNNRVSRIAANIPFIKRNFSPLSFIDVPEELYNQGMMGVYELNEVDLLKDVFLWAYQRSALRYSVIRQSLGEPDTFKLKYRIQIRGLITEIILKIMNSKNANEMIKQTAKDLTETDRKQFTESVETEILSLTEGNSARYKVSIREFQQWKAGWLK